MFAALTAVLLRRSHAAIPNKPPQTPAVWRKRIYARNSRKLGEDFRGAVPWREAGRATQRRLQLEGSVRNHAEPSPRRLLLPASRSGAVPSPLGRRSRARLRSACRWS